MSSMENHIETKYYFQFPWLNGSQEQLLLYMGIDSSDPTQTSLISIIRRFFKEFSDLKSRVITFFDNIANSKEEITTPTDDPTNLAMYPVLQIIIRIIGNRILGNALRNIYSKHCYEELSEIKNREFRNVLKRYYSFLQSICTNLDLSVKVDINTKIDNQIFPFTMDVSSYLQSSNQFKDSRWKLINRYFKKGMVFLTNYDMERLIREHVNLKTQPEYTPLPENIVKALKTIPEIEELEDYVQKLIVDREKRFQSKLVADDEIITHELFAPCIRVILYKLANGENLTHNERLAIAFYYLNTNHSVESTVDLFRTSPDFDEGIARYQVEFAAGIRGRGTKYSMYSCSKMKSLHMCFADHKQFGDPLCVEGGKGKNGKVYPIKNPAGDYIFWKKVQLKWLHEAEIKSKEKLVESKEEGES